MTRNRRTEPISFIESRMVQRLLEAGWSYREIEYNFNISIGAISRIARGTQKTQKAPNRCPKCGKLYTGEQCYACYIRSLPPDWFNDRWFKASLQKSIEDGTCILGLELRPPERRRYEIVRKKKLEQILELLKEAEQYLMFYREPAEIPKDFIRSHRSDSR